jgi:hypothetical protein
MMARTGKTTNEPFNRVVASDETATNVANDIIAIVAVSDCESETITAGEPLIQRL